MKTQKQLLQNLRAAGYAGFNSGAQGVDGQDSQIDDYEIALDRQTIMEDLQLNGVL